MTLSLDDRQVQTYAEPETAPYVVIARFTGAADADEAANYQPVPRINCMVEGQKPGSVLHVSLGRFKI